MFRTWRTDRRGVDIILDPFEMTHPEIAGASLLKNKKCNVKNTDPFGSVFYF